MATIVTSDANVDGVPTDPNASIEQRVSDILADGAMPQSQKRLELEELLGATRESTDMEAYAPMEQRLLHALALLADGGHDYGTPPVDPATPADRED